MPINLEEYETLQNLATDLINATTLYVLSNDDPGRAVDVLLACMDYDIYISELYEDGLIDDNENE